MQFLHFKLLMMNRIFNDFFLITLGKAIIYKKGFFYEIPKLLTLVHVSKTVILADEKAADKRHD